MIQFLLSKYLHGGIVVLILGYGLHKAYQWAFNKGVDSQKIVITQLQNDIKRHEDQYNRWLADTEIANQILSVNQAKTIASLEEALAQERLRVQQTEVIYRDREITTYIPVSMDSPIPIGAVWLLSQSLQGTSTANTAIGTISGATGWDAGTDSGITLSDLVTVIEQNNLRCLQFQHRLDIWNRWYAQSKSDYDEALSSYRATLKED